MRINLTLDIDENDLGEDCSHAAFVRTIQGMVAERFRVDLYSTFREAIQAKLNEPINRELIEGLFQSWLSREVRPGQTAEEMLIERFHVWMRMVVSPNGQERVDYLIKILFHSRLDTLRSVIDEKIIEMAVKSAGTKE